MTCQIIARLFRICGQWLNLILQIWLHDFVYFKDLKIFFLPQFKGTGSCWYPLFNLGSQQKTQVWPPLNVDVKNTKVIKSYKRQTVGASDDNQDFVMTRHIEVGNATEQPEEIFKICCVVNLRLWFYVENSTWKNIRNMKNFIFQL